MDLTVLDLSRWVNREPDESSRSRSPLKPILEEPLRGSPVKGAGRSTERTGGMMPPPSQSGRGPAATNRFLEEDEEEEEDMPVMDKNQNRKSRSKTRKQNKNSTNRVGGGGGGAQNGALDATMSMQVMLLLVHEHMYTLYTVQNIHHNCTYTIGDVWRLF